MSDPTGGPAFPHHVYKYEDTASKHSIHDGMSLRDYFAAKTMQGLLASCADDNGFSDPQGSPEIEDMMASQYTFGARLAYGYADAMIAAREKKP